MRIFIIIPCYNEARHLVKVINEAKNYGQVVVIDDGSADDSYQLAKNQGIVVLRHLVNRGMGAALATGHFYALNQGADIVVDFDADGQHLAEEIPILIKPIIDGQAEVVLGSRFLHDNQTPFFKKWLILKPAISFQNLLLRVKLTDAHNGFRALSAKALQKINLTQDGMAHATEIVEQIKWHQLKYLEVPVTIIYHKFGQGLAAGFKILRDLLFGKINK